MINNFFKQIDPKILQSIHQIDLNAPTDDCAQKACDALNKTVLLGGKRLRPLLTYLVSDFFKLEREKVKVLAEAIEFVHAASLSHDDVIDNATMRRGNPSINIETSNKYAVLAGDYLLANVIVNLSKLDNPRLVSEMASVIQELALGEWIQLDASKTRDYTSKIIEDIAVKKTSSVMSWCFVAPAILSNQSEAVIDHCREIGKHLGIAFQLIDDTLDFSKDSMKDKLLDVKNGIINAVIFNFLCKDLNTFTEYQSGRDITKLIENSDLEESINTIKDEALAHLEICRTHLNEIESKENNDVLMSVFDFIAARSH